MKLNRLSTLGIQFWQIAATGALLCLFAPLLLAGSIGVGWVDYLCFGGMALIFVLLMVHKPVTEPEPRVNMAMIKSDTPLPSTFDRLTVYATDQAISVKDAVVNFAKEHDLLPLEREGKYYFQCKKTRKLYHAEVKRSHIIE